MIRKFECWECHKKFEADDQKWVECPHCHSDNVDYLTSHFKSRYIILAVILIPIVYGALYIKKMFDKQEKGSSIELVSSDDLESSNDSTGIVDEKTLEEFVEIGGQLIATIKGEIEDERSIDEEGNYNCTIDFSNVPTSDFIIVILDHENGNVIQESRDGHFKSIPYSKHDGKYYVQIRTLSGDSLSTKTEIAGYVKVEKISNKMTNEELQKLINNQDPSLLGTDNKYISPICRIMFKDTEGVLPEDLSAVLEYLEFGFWDSVTVVNITYDETKHISSITLKGHKKQNDEK